MDNLSIEKCRPFGNEFGSREDLSRWQQHKFQEVIRRVRLEVPYYRCSLDAAGIDPNAISDLVQVSSLPTIDKATLRDQGSELYRFEGVVDFVSSSGTSGKPVILPVTAEEECLRVHPITRVLKELELNPRDRVLHNFNMYSLYVFGYYSALAVRELGCALIRTGPMMEERQLAIIRELRPTVFIANPHFMIALAKSANELGHEPAKSSLKKGLLATATPFDSDLTPRDFRTAVETEWGLETTIAHYGSSEIGPIGYECRRHQGYHVHEDIIFVERVDPETLERVPPDEPGELLVTHLDAGRGFTAVRYRTGDLVAWSTTEPCACGRTTMRLGPVIGRVDQQVKLRGQNITPDFLLTLVDTVKEVAASVIEAYHLPDTGEEWMRIKVGVDDLATAAQVSAMIQQKIASHVPTTIPIEVVDRKDLQHQQAMAQKNTGGNKVVRFFDLR